MLPTSDSRTVPRLTPADCAAVDSMAGTCSSTTAIRFVAGVLGFCQNRSLGNLVRTAYYHKAATHLPPMLTHAPCASLATCPFSQRGQRRRETIFPNVHLTRQCPSYIVKSMRQPECCNTMRRYAIKAVDREYLLAPVSFLDAIIENSAHPSKASSVRSVSGKGHLRLAI